MASDTESPEKAQLLFIGQQCHSETCYMVDFLPFKCDHCKESFCADHYKPGQHPCDKFDASKHDRVAPPCPLCGTPIAIPLEQDPNLRMEQHIENDCKVTTGRSARPGMPLCARGNCGKRLFAPIKCNDCGKQFCAAHRFPSSHTCARPVQKPAASPSSPAVSKRKNAKPASSAPVSGSTIRNVNQANKPKASTTAPSADARPEARLETGSAKHTNPFSKTDRRAKAEQESRLRGMRERAKKGLLSDSEKVQLAEMEAEVAGSVRKKDCILM
ncbi:hypothetical protein BU17DRAFT_49861 [Hysterangium stoloniferum]|nr:hypothetical protein BU17DRAFT_49861 [Hysterangium stoloniferum]